MKKGRMMYVPGNFMEELEQIKRRERINRNSTAFEILIKDTQLARDLRKKVEKKKDVLGFDL